LEEHLFSQAFTVLTSTLTSGLSTSSPAYIPTPAIIALAATISVHPSYTTRTADKDRHVDSDAAARYLRLVADVVGEPKEAGLREALEFRAEGRRRGSGKRRGVSDMGVGEDGERILAGRYAGEQILWSSGEDFWGVVGWAFNCSVKYEGRWGRWKVWLEVMLLVLERDLEVAVSKGEIGECLLSRYLQSVGGGRNDKRKMMRAILADGSEKSLGEFGEVWREETKAPKVQEDDDERTLKKRKLDLENGDYGDYFDDDSNAEEEKANNTSSTRRSRNKRPSEGTSSPSTTASTTSPFGGLDLRKRLLSLLATLAHASPKTLGLDLSDLWSLYTEFLRPLPLPIYQSFITPRKPYLSPAWQASLCEMMSRSLLGISGSYGLVTRESFEKDIVIATANTSSMVDNAKVGVLVESLARLLWLQGFLQGGLGELESLIGEGVEARLAKCKKRKKGIDGDDGAREMLRLSGERLKVLGGLICRV
jgi:hypothetical protein